MKTQGTKGSKGSETKERILQAAASRFRRQGYVETSVNQVMRDAGLTHGGFYAHFPSKEDLFAEAVRHATDESGDWLETQVKDLEGAAWVEAWVDAYLSDGHCKHLERGCPIPSLMPEVARAGSGACEAFATGLDRRLDRLCPHLPFDRDEAERRAMSAYAHMAGAVMLSRTLDPESSTKLRRDVARAVKELLLGERGITQPSTTGEES
jgi:TetR/AcrR family transcriptional repressor of nem operon